MKRTKFEGQSDPKFKGERGEKRNRDAITGKEALLKTYEEMGIDSETYCAGLRSRIHKQRCYLKIRTGERD